MSKRTQGVTVALALFAAVSAGYVAGRRAFDDADRRRQAESPLLDPRTVMPQYRSTSAIAAFTGTTDVERLALLQNQLGMQVWKVAVVSTWKSKIVDYRFVVREKGKADVELGEVGMGGGTPEPQADMPNGVVVSLTPLGESGLPGAKKLRLSVGMSTMDVDNPFKGSSSWGSVMGDSYTAPTKLGARLELPLMESKSCHMTPPDGIHSPRMVTKPTRVLVLTMEPRDH